ncbi:MAG: sugar kinase [Candidatus Doudnabacteria bacterium]|nr:sugar kinase [Candidatus Doudnabacteria bacterium]
MNTKSSNNGLLIVGSVAYDSIKTPFGKIDKTLGGSASYFSLAASYFTTAALVAVVGEDFADADKDVLAKRNVNLEGLKKIPGKTFAWGGEYSFDMNTRTTLFTELNVFENFKPQLSETQSQAQYVFLGNTHPALQLEVLNQISSPKLVGLDTMNYWIEKALPDLKNVLGKVDLLVINDSEARELSGEHNLVKAVKQILLLLKQSPKTALIIKRGEYGLLLFAENEIFNLPGYPLEDVIDPTGAGDSFAGGFMGYLAKIDATNMESLKQACVAGSALASFCVEKLGTERLQNLTENNIQKRMNDFKTLTHFEI